MAQLKNIGFQTEVVTETELTTALDGKVDKVSGKQLSQEDYTTTEKSKLAGIESGAEVNNISDGAVLDLTDGGDTTLHTHDGRYYTESETDALLGGKMDESTYDPSGTARQVAFACTVQSAITDYTFTGAEPTSSGYLVTTASNRTVNINADLFTTGYEVIFCKGTDNANTVTLDAGSGNNINGSQTYVLDKFNETVVLVKDGDSTWKIKAGNVPKSTLVQTTSSQTIGGVKTFSDTMKINAPLYLLENQQIRWFNSTGTIERSRIIGDNSGNMIFANGSSPTERIRVSSSGNVGIGETNPGAKLEVKSSAVSSSPFRVTSSDGQILASVYEESDTRASFSINNASAVQTVRFDTNGTSYINGGSLGVGMTNPTFATGNGIGIFNSTSPRLRLYNTASGTTSNDGLDIALYLADGYIINRENGALRFVVSNVTEAMTINPVGSVGIGNISPGEKLDVSGNTRTNGNFVAYSSAGSLASILIAPDGTNSLNKIISQKGPADTTARNLGIYTGVNERIRIDLNGNVGIGETSPDYKLDVNGSFGFTPGIGTTITPVDNGDIVFESTSNTSLVIKMKGSDGVIRSTTLTLS